MFGMIPQTAQSPTMNDQFGANLPGIQGSRTIGPGTTGLSQSPLLQQQQNQMLIKLLQQKGTPNG